MKIKLYFFMNLGDYVILILNNKKMVLKVFLF